MNFELRFLAVTVRDMEDVLDQTREQFGKHKYEEYKLLMRLALSDITSDPFAHPAKHRPEIRSDARIFHLARRRKPASHFFLYRVLDYKYIEVGRLLHDSMDLAKHLPPGFGASENS
ncbi:MAG TPA: hypothetical protein VFE47_17240 [Tepidisphaeraceae bacterium]|jgi:toxin ParE1/3/4|nr:hypothetical protein [Tepidisphaeraceae bacterium]